MSGPQAMDCVLRMAKAGIGRPVLVPTDGLLRVHPTVRIARAPTTPPDHVILYRPELEPEKEYLVCSWCGFLLASCASASMMLACPASRLLRMESNDRPFGAQRTRVGPGAGIYCRSVTSRILHTSQSCRNTPTP